MKNKAAVMIILMMVFLLFSGCTENTRPSNQENTVDDSTNDNSNHNDSATIPGWHLKEIRDYGTKINSTNPYYSYDIIYQRGNVTTILFGGDGQELRVRTTHDIPPDFIAAADELSIQVIKQGLVVNHGGLGLYDTSSIAIDFPELELGFASSSIYRLSNSTYGEFFKLGYGDEPGSVKEGVFTATAPAANEFNGNFSITFNFENGAKYGTEYVYEWRG